MPTYEIVWYLQQQHKLHKMWGFLNVVKNDEGAHRASLLAYRCLMAD